MNVQQAIRSAMNFSDAVLLAYLADLNDADLLERPGPGCNHLAYQLGHLIVSEGQLLAILGTEKAVSLPAGFAERHTKEHAASDDPAQFCTKQEYLDLFAASRAAAAAALEELSAEDLDQPSPENFRSFVPTIGDLMLLVANHPLMHAGQFVPVRRRLGKPVVM